MRTSQEHHFDLSERDRFNPFVLSHCQRSLEFEKKFEHYNKRYFSSALPSYKVMLCTKPRTFAHEICGYCLHQGKDKRGSILIRAGMSRKSTEQTLVHEMAHAKLLGLRKEVHGKRFILELQRLRKLGAPLSSHDFDKVRDNSRLSREPIKLSRKNIHRLIFEAIVIEKLPPRLVPRYLEHEMMIPYSVISKWLDVRDEIEKYA